MDELTRLATHTWAMYYFGGLGDALVIVGIVSAVMDVTIAGFTPVLWFLLAIACYIGLIWVVALRILAHLESRTEK